MKTAQAAAKLGINALLIIRADGEEEEATPLVPRVHPDKPDASAV